MNNNPEFSDVVSVLYKLSTNPLQRVSKQLGNPLHGFEQSMNFPFLDWSFVPSHPDSALRKPPASSPPCIPHIIEMKKCWFSFLKKKKNHSALLIKTWFNLINYLSPSLIIYFYQFNWSFINFHNLVIYHFNFFN